MSESNSSNHLCVCNVDHDIPVDQVTTDKTVFVNNYKKKEFSIPIGNKFSSDFTEFTETKKKADVELISPPIVNGCVKFKTLTITDDLSIFLIYKNNAVDRNEKEKLINTNDNKDDSSRGVHDFEKSNKRRKKSSNLIECSKSEEEVKLRRSLKKKLNQDSLCNHQSVETDLGPPVWKSCILSDRSVLYYRDPSNSIQVIPAKSIIKETTKLQDKLAEKKSSVRVCSKPEEVIKRNLNQYTLCNSQPVANDLGSPVLKSSFEQCLFQKITGLNLKLKYTKLFTRTRADDIFIQLEKQVKYNSEHKAKVCGRMHHGLHHISHKQVSYDDAALLYCPVLKIIKKHIEKICKYKFNFVTVNRYKDGEDHMALHQDNEKVLEPHSPIASVSFGQDRDFVFVHRDDVLEKLPQKNEPIRQYHVSLEHGSILLMEWPTNCHWYHSLPATGNAENVYINLTFHCRVK